MERFHGRLLDGDRVLFDRVSGYLEREARGVGGAWSGRLEVHEGGVLGPASGRPCRLVLEDGRAGEVAITQVHASNSAGIALLEFRAPVGLR